MEYYKQFNVVMNALDNRGEVASIYCTTLHFKIKSVLGHECSYPSLNSLKHLGVFLLPL